MTAKQKLGFLHDQINRAEMGLTKIIHCPYCDTDLDFSPQNPADTGYHAPTCCADFALAVIAILQRHEQNDMRDLADRLHKKTGGLPVFN